MTDSPNLAELARQIIEHEAGGSPDPAASAAALEAACGRLRTHLTDFLGAGGVAALFRRALHLAQRDQPALTAVGPAGESACFSDLAQSLADATDEDAAAAVTSILTHLLELLVMLLGEELGTRPVHKFWPHLISAGETEE